jgi:subtilisin
LKKSIASILLFALILSSTITIGIAAAQPFEEARVIVGFKGRPDASLIRTHGGKINQEYRFISAIACSLPKHAIEALKNNPLIAYVEEDIQVDAIDAELTASWGVERIGAATVQATGNTGSGIKVAVIDTGINYNHEDLKPNYVFVNNLPAGYDFVNKDSDPMDDNGHGTHCAGVIAAADNDIAVVGVAPQAKLIAYKVLNSQGSGYVSDVIAAIQRAIDDGAQVISMSLGSSTSSTALQQACDDAYNNHNVVLVAAAGNSGQARFGSSIIYPARYASVIAVGATDKNDARASFSSTGPELDIMAPGVNILSDYIDVSPDDGRNIDTLYMSGTSMACPHVAGTAALVLASNQANWYPTYTDNDGVWESSEVTNVLINTADDLGATGKDNLYGYGLVDADEAALPPKPTLEKAYPPASIALTRGTISSGNSGSLAGNDGSYLVISSARVNSFTQAIDWYSTATIAESPSAVTSLKITYDGKYSTSLTQKLYVYDFTANSWVQIDSRTVGTSDTLISWSTTNPAKYISASKEIRLRVYASRTGSSVFTCSADFTAYTIKYTI